MPACVRCGSRNILFRFSILAPIVYLGTGQKPVKCPNCGWKGWLKHTGSASWTNKRRRKYRSSGSGHHSSHKPSAIPRDLQLTEDDLTRQESWLSPRAEGTAPAQSPPPDESPTQASEGTAAMSWPPAEPPAAPQEPDLAALDEQLRQRREEEAARRAARAATPDAPTEPSQPAGHEQADRTTEPAPRAESRPKRERRHHTHGEERHSSSRPRSSSSHGSSAHRSSGRHPSKKREH